MLNEERLYVVFQHTISIKIVVFYEVKKELGVLQGFTEQQNGIRFRS